MPLPWVRLDTNWYTNPKFLDLFHRRRYSAICLYMAALAYSGAHDLDGFVPEGVLRLLAGRPADAADLVAAELWHKRDGGWDIHGWDERQVQRKTQAALSDAGRKAACIRWHDQPCGCWQT
jgi:hypothetical protein